MDKAKQNEAYTNLSDEEREKIESGVNQLTVAYHGDDHLLIRAKIDELNSVTMKLAENMMSLMDTLVKLKPSSAKGTYVKSITISTTHGPGIKIDPSTAVTAKA